MNKKLSRRTALIAGGLVTLGAVEVSRYLAFPSHEAPQPGREAITMAGFGGCFRLKRIEPPDWARQPDLHIFRVTVADYAAIQRHRDKLLQAVHSEVEEYLNTPGLYTEGKGFPDRQRMTGDYYIGSESYIAHDDPTWFQISIMCRCLEHPKTGVARDDDYLGLDVWLKCVPSQWSLFEVFRNTDSSVI